MTDPTKQAQAATAKTAREVIAEAVKAVEEWAHPYTPAEAALRDGYNTLFRKICGTHVGLRALLDAPEGGVERLVEAGERVRVVHEKRDEEDGGPRVCVPECCGCAFNAALAALRASPESVGWLQAQAEAYNLRLLHERTRERDALKADLRSCAESFDAAKAEALKARAEVQRLKADLAAARGEVERMRAEIAGDSHTCANGTVRPYPSVVCSLCVSRGITPPPATEAPISERARLVYEGATRLWARTTWGGSDEDVSARVTAFASAMLAAAERAAKAPQAEG